MINTSSVIVSVALWLLVAVSQNGVAVAFTAFAARGNGFHLNSRCSIEFKDARRNSEVFMSSSNDDGSAPIVALNVILRIKPEVRDKFLEVILNNQKGTEDKELEPLALEYIFGEDTSEPNTFHFHEKYLGEEGIAAHNAAPHFLVWEDFAQTNPFTSPPEVYKYVIYDN
jgi:quinol monooxygenase YgiN